MTKRMLIDTTHAEETRVVVMDGDRVEEYDVETSTRKQLKGNIYLAKIVRIEPSLQAAFVEYGGNRHGFLAFSEIHPDYFQIPVADREKLLALQEEEYAAEQRAEAAGRDTEAEGAEEEPRAFAENGSENGDEAEEEPETVGGENDTGEESAASRRTMRFLRNYKIQEVIRRRQVVLVQVVKEERGNKGAALTTYLSLAGRYCVLMPNALRGGGVSRKITSDSDRKRLREIIAELHLPRTMAMIIRTAGAGRPGPEIIRDCEYLLQLWDDIRERALSSIAPSLVYEEASLIKRAIRDLFSKDIKEILIDGEPAWKGAREFMRLLVPQSAGKVKLWQNRGQSLFARYNVEGHLDAMFSPTARLKSGGYLVINQTEALVSIDVNSGKSTAQRNIEETALRTNLEAAEEVARQLRLRDLAGLVVIDFIDMESRRHNAQVEKRLKDALRSDRARIQVGHISHFGLLEMSRQRLRPSLAESLLTPCPHCQGTGFVRGTESSSLHVLRAIEEEGTRQRAAEIEVHIGPAIAVYILNNKRDWLSEIERRHRMHVVFRTEEDLPASELRIERIRPQSAAVPAGPSSQVRTIEIIEDEAPSAYNSPAYNSPAYDSPAYAASEEETAEEEIAVSEIAAADAVPGEEPGEEEGERRRRRRRRRRGGRRETFGEAETAQAQPAEERTPEFAGKPAPDGAESAEVVPGRRRTRFKRVQRENRPEEEAFSPRMPSPSERPLSTYAGPTPADPFGGSFDIFDVIEQAELAEASRLAASPAAEAAEIVEDVLAEEAPVVEMVEIVTEPESAPVKRGRGRPRRAAKAEAPQIEAPISEEPASEAPAVTEAAPEVAVKAEAPAKPRRGRPRKAVAPAAEETVTQEAAETPAKSEGPEKPVLEKPEPAEKPKRGRGRPRKSAAAPEEVTAEAAQTEDGNILQPVDIDALPPAPRRAGWWKR